MKNLFFVLGTVVLLASCKKDSAVNPTATKNLVKATYVWDNQTPEIDEYTYDTKGRIATHKDDSRTETFNYVSPALLVVTRKNNADNSLNRTYECTLNDKGLMTKMLMKDPAGVVTYTYNYTYNADGYMIRLEGIQPVGTGYEVDYTIVNGNVVSSTNYNGGVLNRTGQYIYDNSKINKASGSHGGYWPSSTLFGKASKNLLSEYKSISPAGALTWHTQYNYVLDANGYPVKLTTTNVLEGKQGVDTFIYQ